MNIARKITLLVGFFTLLLAVPTFAQDMMTPSVTVDGQVVVNDTVRIGEVVSDGPGFIVIHAVADDGTFGDVIGYEPVDTGISYHVVVDIDTTMATGTLFAMLHTDDNTVGEYEFGSVEGADGPVTVDEEIITPTFNVEILSASDQFVDGTVTIDSVTVSQDGFVVIHEGTADEFGAVIGFAPVSAGTTTDVAVELDGDATDVIWPMLHVDNETMGEYEFGEVEGADGPVSIDGAVATKPIYTVPHMRVPDQAIVPGDSQELTGATLDVNSVLSDGPGFIVIHADNGEGAPGEVIGFQTVEDGLTTDFVVGLEGEATPTLFPMLHVDDNTVGEYEFGEVDGADAPVSVDGDVVVFPIDASPSITYAGILEGNMLTIEKAVIDEGGWLVIHADNGEGAPGDVIGAKRISEGVNFDVTVELDEDAITETLFPMLHYDTNEIGTYEFGTVDGADAPVSVNGDVVVGSLEPAVIE